MTLPTDLAELARKIQRLEDIEAIKRLKYQISEPIERRPNVTFSALATRGHRLPPGDLAPFRREDG